MRTTKDLQAAAAATISSQGFKDRNLLFQELDNLYNLAWSLPGAEKIWGLHEVKTSAPNTNINVATEAFSEALPIVHIDPFGNDFANQEENEKQEKWARWTLSKLVNRTGGNVIADIVESAFRYGMVCFRTEHVDYARKANAEKTGKRARARRQHGPFSWKVYNPSDVYPAYSDDGLESVTVCQVKLAHEVLARWGKAADPLRAKLDSTANADKDHTWKFKYVTEYYYCDYEEVLCWAVPCNSTTPADAASKDAVELFHEDNKLEFLNWVVESRISSLEKEGRGKYRAALNWTDNAAGYTGSINTGMTLAMTKGIQGAGKPHYLVQSPGESTVEIDWTNLSGGTLKVPIGTTVTEQRPVPLDTGLIQLVQMIAEYQNEAAVSMALAGKGGGGDESYAHLQARVKTGAASIGPGKEIAQRALAEGVIQNFEWASFMQEDMTAVLPGLSDPYTLLADEIDVEHLYLTVELRDTQEADIQTFNKAAIGKQFGLSDTKALEMAGIEDPQGELERSLFERIVQEKVSNLFLVARAEAEAQAQQIMQAAEQEAQQAQAPPQAPPQETNPIYSNQMPQDARPPFDMSGNVAGLAYDPNSGGMPPALVNPGQNTFETQRGGPRPNGEG